MLGYFVNRLGKLTKIDNRAQLREKRLKLSPGILAMTPDFVG